MNAFAILGLSISASEDDIKKAYRKLAIKHHPDRNPNNPKAEIEFAKISKAYRIALEKAKRNGKRSFYGNHSSSEYFGNYKETNYSKKQSEFNKNFDPFKYSNKKQTPPKAKEEPAKKFTVEQTSYAQEEEPSVFNHLFLLSFILSGVAGGLIYGFSMNLMWSLAGFFAGITISLVVKLLAPQSASTSKL